MLPCMYEVILNTFCVSTFIKTISAIRKLIIVKFLLLKCFRYFTDVSGSEEDLTKEILTKVFRDLPGTPSSITKIIDRETRWRNHRMDGVHNKRIQLLGFDTCRRIALEFMKTIVRESRNKSSSLNTIEVENFQRDESLHVEDRILANDFRKQESNAQEIRARMLRSLDLHLAAKQRDYTSKLMRSSI